MKFYYNGQLMRTSKNHNYTHAVIIETEKGIKLYGCHKDKKGCEAEITRAINECNRGIENAQAAIKALNTGKAGYYSKYGRNRSCWVPFRECTDPTVKHYEDWIENNKASIDRVRRTWKVVELEAR